MEEQKSEMGKAVFVYGNQTGQGEGMMTTGSDIKISSHSNPGNLVIENQTATSSSVQEPFPSSVTENHIDTMGGHEGLSKSSEGINQEPVQDISALTLDNFEWKMTIYKNLSQARKQGNTKTTRRPEDEKSAQPSTDKSLLLPRTVILALPTGAMIIPTVFLGITYIVGKVFGQIEDTVMLYISDLGTSQPHSSIFTMGLVLSSFFTLGIVLVRYLQVKCILQGAGCANRASFVIGLLIVLGKLTTSCFQVSRHIIVHYSGAFVYFVSASLYCGFQSFISYRTRDITGKYLCFFRIMATFLMISCSLLFAIFLMPFLHQYNNGPLHVAQGCEWMVAALKVAFMLSFVFDFRRLEIRIDIAETSTEVDQTV